MSQFHRVWSWKTLSLLAGISVLSSLLAHPAGAQVSGDPLRDLDTSADSSRDPFSGDSSDSMRGAYELFHRLNLSGGMSMDQYRQQQQGNIRSAAEQFRQQRQNLLNGGEATQPSSPQQLEQPTQE